MHTFDIGSRLKAGNATSHFLGNDDFLVIVRVASLNGF
jgi:hypothetical protein